MTGTSIPMIRAHKIRLNPTEEQATYLRQACGVARFTFNWALAEWKRQKEAGVEKCGALTLKKQFNAIKKEQFPWATEVPKSAGDTGFFNFEAAMKNYYDSVKGKRKGARMGFPKFKSKKRSKLSFCMAYDQVTERNYVGHDFRMPKMAKPINMTEPLRFSGKVKESIVSFSAGHWWVSVIVDIVDPAPLDHPVKSVGIDLGIKTLAKLSDDKEFENQKLLKSELRKLKRLGRRVSRRSLLYKLRKAHPEATQKQLLGMYAAACAKAKEEKRPVESRRWERAKLQLARHQTHIANKRAFHIHKMTKQIAVTYQIVGVEDLNVKGMMKNHRLALSIGDASFGEIIRQLEYKTAATGGRVVKVGRFFASSKTCGDCGHVNKDLTLSDRTWTCKGCGAIHDRDWNASRNIEVEALRLIGA